MANPLFPVFRTTEPLYKYFEHFPVAPGNVQINADLLNLFADQQYTNEEQTRIFMTELFENEMNFPKLAKIAKVIIGIALSSSKAEGAFDVAG